MDRSKRRRVFKKICEMLDREILFTDKNGYVLESSNESRLGDYVELPETFDDSDIVEFKGCLAYRFKTRESKEHYLLIKDNDPKTAKLLRVIALMILDEFDDISKEDFIREVLTSNLSDEHIIENLKKFNINMTDKLMVYVVQVKMEFAEEVETIMTSLFPNDNIIKYNNMRYAFIMKRQSERSMDVAKLIFKAIFEELMFEPQIGIGVEIEDMLNLKQSFEKAQMALEIGHVHYPMQKIHSYKRMVVPLLIKGMKLSDLEGMYMDIAKNINSVINDEELILTALRFFENDLNITETSRKLFVHRNTLIYRLNKILKLTKFDLRKFEDALNFNIGLYMHTVLKENKAL